jgi:hypothetical protein
MEAKLERYKKARMLEPLKIKKWTSHKHLETHEF